MKKFVKLTAIALAISGLATGVAQAAKEGAYAGLGLGYSHLNVSKSDVSAYFGEDADVTRAIKNNSRNIGGRIFGGYNFNQNFGVEAGFTKYADAKFNLTDTISAFGNDFAGHGKKTYSLNAFDVVGKAYLPVAEDFNLYALGGLAYVSSKAVSSYNAALSGESFFEQETVKTHKVRPIVGVGANYTIPGTNVTAGVEYSHLQGSGNLKTSAKAIPSADLVALSVSYNFG